MSKVFSAKYYQENKDYKRKLVKDVKIVLKKEKQNCSKEGKEKSNNMVVNVTKISQKMKNKILLSIEKDIIEQEKLLYYILGNFASL